jgi:hypothetical protein
MERLRSSLRLVGLISNLNVTWSASISRSLLWFASQSEARRVRRVRLVLLTVVSQLYATTLCVILEAPGPAEKHPSVESKPGPGANEPEGLRCQLR